MFDHDPHFLADRVRMKLDERLEKVFHFILVIAGIVLDLLEKPPVGFVGRVVPQDVEDESFLDRLAHGVKVERLELPVRALRPEKLQCFCLGRRREGEHREVREPAALLHFGQDRVFELLFGRRRLGFLPLRFFEAPGRQNHLEALRALSRLRGMGFVDDDGEAMPRELADIFHDHGKFLQSGHDDGLSRLECLFELAGGRVDILDDAQRLLELAHGRLELAVEDAPVGDDDDRVENPLIGVVVKRRQPVGEPGDGEALAAARRMLDEIALARAVLSGVGDKAPDGVELLIARENKGSLSGLPAFLVLFLDLMDELADEVEDAVAGPDLLPEVGRGVAFLRRRDGRISRAAELPLVEGQETASSARRVALSHRRDPGPRRNGRDSGRMRRAARADRGPSCIAGWRPRPSAP